MRYELTDDEWAAIKPMLPNEPRGVPRDDPRISQPALAPPRDSAASLATARRSALPVNPAGSASRK
jgi:transposase